LTIFGWDLSHFDLPSIGDAVGEGFSFFTHKAGGDANDAEIGTWWGGVKGTDPAKALLGAYWVVYPGNGAGRADQFLARLDATCKGWRDRPFILQLDCEKWNNDASTVPSKADIKAFCDRLVAKMPKLRPIVYAPKWVYGDSLAGLGYPLWASSYVGGAGTASKLYPGDSSSKWGAYSGQTPAILQFTSSATIAGQTTCDANAFRGTLAQLTALVAPGWSSNIMAGFDKNDLDVMVHTDGVIKAPPGSKNADGTANTAWGMEGYFFNTYGVADAGRDHAANAETNSANALAAVKTLATQVAALTAQVGALAKPTVDVDALAAALEPHIDGITLDQMKALLASLDIKVVAGA